MDHGSEKAWRAIKEVAEEFESLFLNEMLKRAHAAKLAKSILSNDAQETYTSLLNQERAKLIAKSQSFGIAEALVNQFSKSLKPWFCNVILAKYT